MRNKPSHKEELRRLALHLLAEAGHLPELKVPHAADAALPAQQGEGRALLRQHKLRRRRT
jgi:hypothetical protein